MSPESRTTEVLLHATVPPSSVRGMMTSAQTKALSPSPEAAEKIATCLFELPVLVSRQMLRCLHAFSIEAVVTVLLPVLLMQKYMRDAVKSNPTLQQQRGWLQQQQQLLLLNHKMFSFVDGAVALQELVEGGLLQQHSGCSSDFAGSNFAAAPQPKDLRVYHALLHAVNLRLAELAAQQHQRGGNEIGGPAVFAALPGEAPLSPAAVLRRMRQQQLLPTDDRQEETHVHKGNSGSASVAELLAKDSCGLQRLEEEEQQQPSHPWHQPPLHTQQEAGVAGGKAQRETGRQPRGRRKRAAHQQLLRQDDDEAPPPIGAATAAETEDLIGDSRLIVRSGVLQAELQRRGECLSALPFVDFDGQPHSRG
ncbi:hypothetical protein cyc_09123 [Cyclospora cayetanensis]|uniref:Uncharacterized protein n=1 Tax=Cyclospora cayetanensis TaxID=88456 RepID=A0A1D3D5N0_9EIME|nr:hypothetical protein cyc_09123 [Cyclospora cayetanensis]